MPKTSAKNGHQDKRSPKKKSQKAKVTSRFGSKRKLSRMGKKVKKGTMGPGTEYITRAQALRKLQVTLKDFRRLCILKGIYPRVPEGKASSGKDKIYYDIKDLSFLAHDPLMERFREFKIFMKKVRKSADRKDVNEARRKHDAKPHISLVHLVKERYPRFIDALRDMDDALSMIHLFASLPSAGRITPEKTKRCQELVRHWQYYVARSRSLRKVFVSVKGVYFQSETMGETITWLAPHAFTQAIPREVDFRVMLTFLEFYETFLAFVMFKCYQAVGLAYPPTIENSLDAVGSNLLAVIPKELESATDASNGDSEKEGNKTEDNNNSNNNSNNNNNNNNSVSSKGVSSEQRVQMRESSMRLASLEDKMTEIKAKDKSQSNDDDEDNNDVTVADIDVDDDANEEAVALALKGPLKEAFTALHQLDTADGFGREERAVFGETTEKSENKDEEDDDEEGVSNSKKGYKEMIFKGLVFFINRETPLEWLQLCCAASGATIGWQGEGSPFPSSYEGITHHVIDRPMSSMPEFHKIASREYIQPQWIFDSINANMLLPSKWYAPDSKLPPHLSPFVDDHKVGYLPRFREEIAKLRNKDNGNIGNDDIKVLEDEDHVFQRVNKGGKSSKKEEEEEEEEVLDTQKDDKEDESDSNSDESESEEEEEEEEEEEIPAATKKGGKGVVYAAKATNQTEVSLFILFTLFLYIPVHVH